MLYKWIKDNAEEKGDNYQFVSRHIPYLTRRFEDVEKNNIHYEMKWINEGKVYVDIILAIALATRREVISLANKGLSSNDLNARFLIEYFDLYLRTNKLEQLSVASHLGYIQNSFIHPLIDTEYHIVPKDEGERKKLQAIQCQGTVEDWIKNLLEPLYDNPKAMFPVISSFASILLMRYNLPSIVVDISGISTSGKSTVLRICASVWGYFDDYINSMLTTNIAVERMAGFLNAFPFILDDSNTAQDPKGLENIIYLFGNGTGKMRGSKVGSQETSSWRATMITTGENNILEYTKNQGSVARVIPITNLKFENKNTEYFTKLNDNVKLYYGSIGVEFIKRWRKSFDRFNGRFEKLARKYQAAPKINNIMIRIALHFAFVVFVAEVLNELFKEEDMNIPVDSFEKLFLDICADNHHVDRAKNMLIEILEELQANLNHVFKDFQPNYGIHAIVNANGLFLTVNYLKRKLQENERQIRNAWKAQNYTVQQNNNGKSVDYLAITHKGQSFRVVQVNHTFLTDQGFNFIK